MVQGFRELAMINWLQDRGYGGGKMLFSWKAGSRKPGLKLPASGALEGQESVKNREKGAGDEM